VLGRVAERLKLLIVTSRDYLRPRNFVARIASQLANLVQRGLQRGRMLSR